MRSFSLFRTVKLLSLHHLAVLRHAQRRWRDSAMLSQALLRQRLGSLQGVSRSSRLMLADSLLELGDLRGAHEALPLALAELGLIDEYEFVVHPRVAGHGPTLFAGLSKPLDLKLVSRLEFGSGAVALRYEPRG